MRTWGYVLRTADLPEGMTQPDAVSKWPAAQRAAAHQPAVGMS